MGNEDVVLLPCLGACCPMNVFPESALQPRSIHKIILHRHQITSLAQMTGDRRQCQRHTGVTNPLRQSPVANGGFRGDGTTLSENGIYGDRHTLKMLLDDVCCLYSSHGVGMNDTIKGEVPHLQSVPCHVSLLFPCIPASQHLHPNVSQHMLLLLHCYKLD